MGKKSLGLRSSTRSVLKMVFYVAGGVTGIVVGSVGLISHFVREPTNWLLGGLFTLIFFVGIFLLGLALGDGYEHFY